MNKLWLSVLAFAVFLGYGPDWGPYYVSLFYGENIRVIGNIDKFSRPCDQPPSSTAQCTHKYVIPADVFKAIPDSSALGAGIILSASVYRCADVGSSEQIVFDDQKIPGRLIDLHSLRKGKATKQVLY
ncbi:MAG: hypothetical protein HY074_13105 [Deltaproteobacteria bacterium]|nr:hypothetical protein [Deltaproteobacteria bacterium]